MASPTLSSPPLQFNSLTEDKDIVPQHDSLSLPMSPPLSQEFNVSFVGPDPALEANKHFDQHHTDDHPLHHHSHSIHPLDLSSPTTPKKTLNWVNALPSHFDTASSDNPRKRRRRTNREELEILEHAFSKNLLPDAATRQELGDRLGMSVRAVQIWFQNRRQTLRKKSVSSGAHHLGSEEDLSRSDAESSDSLHRRSSGDSALSLSPRICPRMGTGMGRGLKRGSKSCSNLLSTSPPSASQLGSQLLRAETCSSLPTIMSVLPSITEAPSARSTMSPKPARASTPSPPSPQVKQEPVPEPSAVVVKAEVIDSSPHDFLKAASTGVQDIVDIKTADLHLCMLLEEAKRSSGQRTTPVMALWPETSSKPVLNASSSVVFPSTTTFPTPKRTMSTPSMRSPTSTSQHRYSLTSSHQPSRPYSKIARKHRSMPEPISSSSFHEGHAYPRTVSLMEQVINRQQQQQQQRPAPTNFRQSALSSASKYSLDSVCNKATRSITPDINSTGFSAVQLARRLQYVVSSNLKRVQSQSPIPVPLEQLPQRQHQGGGRAGQPAMRARRLSIGKFLFDSDETDEDTPAHSRRIPSLKRQSHSNRFQDSDLSLTHQAQKRRAGSATSILSSIVGQDQTVEADGDETDEEDFVLAQRERAMKRLDLSESFMASRKTPSSVSLDLRHQQQRQQQTRVQDWRNAHKMPRKSFKSSISTLSLATSSPTRQYGLELERSHSPVTSYSILERSRSWNNSGSPSERQQSTIAGISTTLSVVVPKTPTEEPKDLNMDELECANVLAGLGWGR